MFDEDDELNRYMSSESFYGTHYATHTHTQKPQITSEIFQNICIRIDMQSIVE